jgi:GNAT superfamily N-acetyltransferase
VCGYKWILGILEEGFVVVADLNGRIVGAACASPYRPPWSLMWLIDMEFLYVLPSFRRDGIAEGLVGAVEGWADVRKASLTFGIQTGEKPLLKDRMMKIAGWEYVGGNFLRPAHGQEQEDNLATIRES